MEKIDFLATDKMVLNGLLYDAKGKTVILSLHGMGSNCLKERENIFAKNANKNGISYFCFNSRGSDLARYTRRKIDGKKEKFLNGTTYEDVLESYCDVVGAILKLKELGYENIYLQGHSLGCTKMVYTFNKLKEEENDILKNIKGIILLSLIDIPTAIKVFTGSKTQEYINLAETKCAKGNDKDLMPKECFIHPISAKTFLRYAKYNQEIDFARYGKDNELKTLNKIKIPLFMRWGNDKEMILQKADELVEMLKNIIKNPKKDINYIDGANHSYEGKEEILSNEILSFIKTNEK